MIKEWQPRSDFLRRLDADARAQGRVEGREEGLVAGRVEGRAQGRAEGLIEGRVEGRLQGHVEGRLEGRLLGEREMLLRLLQSRFGELSPVDVERVNAAPPYDLVLFGEALLRGRSLMDVLYR